MRGRTPRRLRARRGRSLGACRPHKIRDAHRGGPVRRAGDRSPSSARRPVLPSRAHPPHRWRTQSPIAGAQKASHRVRPSASRLAVREQLPKHTQRVAQRPRANFAELLDQTLLIERSDLVEQNKAALSFKRQRNAVRSTFASSRHRCHDHRSQKIVEFRGRDHHARASLAYLATNRRIERGKPYLAADYHVRSASPALANSGQASSSASAPASA